MNETPKRGDRITITESHSALAGCDGIVLSASSGTTLAMVGGLPQRLDRHEFRITTRTARRTNRPKLIGDPPPWIHSQDDGPTLQMHTRQDPKDR